VRDGLAGLIEALRPDAVHAVGLRAMTMASLALRSAGLQPPAVILHLTGRGYLGYARTVPAYLLRRLVHAAIRRCSARCNAWLAADNDDDAAEMVAARIVPAERAVVLPGPGIDPARYPQLPEPQNAVPRIAYVGRMLRSKGLDVIIGAHRLLRSRGIAAELALCGDAEPPGRDAIPLEALERWSRRPGVTWFGYAADVVGVWRGANIGVVPALGGEGMPRAMLEAAACGRPLVVSDIPGCRQFVRPGVEGLVVPPGNAGALAAALARLLADRELRRQAGAAARRRVIRDFTEAAVRAKVRDLYQQAHLAAYGTVDRVGLGE
jgi:glycosyltransferase involved in cell wall biosynthesis